MAFNKGTFSTEEEAETTIKFKLQEKQIWMCLNFPNMTLSQHEHTSSFWKTHVWNHQVETKMLFYASRYKFGFTYQKTKANKTKNISSRLTTTAQNCAHYRHIFQICREKTNLKWNLSLNFLTNALSFSTSSYFTSCDLAQPGKAFYGAITPHLFYGDIFFSHLLLPMLFYVFTKS